jgi:hypothetical protein
MTRRAILKLVALPFAVIALILPLFLSSVISGHKTFLKVASALQHQGYIINWVGSPVKITRNHGPWKVSLDPIGRPGGFYSISASGTRGHASLKVYWRELPDNSVEIDEIYWTKPMGQDELVWRLFRAD